MKKQNEQPWQLQMFNKTLKKKLRFREMQSYLQGLSDQDNCLLVTCGDNNGAMNYHLRALGGKWAWADLEPDNVDDISALLGETVHFIENMTFPFEDEAFDRIILIDVLEHIDAPEACLKEISRIAKQDCDIIVTVPGGDPGKIINRLKSLSGMTKEEYGHVRDGFTVAELSELLQHNEIKPYKTSTFSGFFTELVEFIINFGYVKILTGKNNAERKEGEIAPQNKDQLKSVSKVYRIYSMIYPFAVLISQLDRLLFFTDGYVTIVAGRKADRA